MTIDRIFIALMTLCGLFNALVLVLFPESREFRVPPYLWVIIAMVIFEGAAYARSRGAPGTMIAMDSRVIGFLIAIVLTLGGPYVAGMPLARLL